MQSGLIYTSSHQEFEIMFFATKDRLHYFISRFIKDQQAVKDILQNVYLTAWQNFEAISDRDKIMPLLYTYARRLTIKEVKREAKRLQVEMTMTSSDWYDEEARMDGKELEKLVEKAVAAMPARRQQVFRLKREENLSYAEISERLHISPQTVANHMSEALEFLRQQLKKEQVALLVIMFLPRLY